MKQMIHQETKQTIDFYSSKAYGEDSSADDLLQLFLSEHSWRQDFITMYGKTHPLPRLTAWYGDHGLQYSYSGIKMKANGWPEFLIPIRNIINEQLLTQFPDAKEMNSVLINYYRHGQDYMSWHNDHEVELGDSPIVSTYSLGVQRAIQFRKFQDKSDKLEFDLKHNEHFIMGPSVQPLYQHQIPKRMRVKEPRISLTFRHIIN